MWSQAIRQMLRAQKVMVVDIWERVRDVLSGQHSGKPMEERKEAASQLLGTLHWQLDSMVGKMTKIQDVRCPDPHVAMCHVACS